MKKLILVAAAIALLLAGIVRLELSAQPEAKLDAKAADAAVKSPELVAKQQAMIEAARRTYEAFDALFELGSTTQGHIYVWSSHLRSSQARAADTKKELMSARKEQHERMNRLLTPKRLYF